MCCNGGESSRRRRISGHEEKDIEKVVSIRKLVTESKMHDEVKVSMKQGVYHSSHVQLLNTQMHPGDILLHDHRCSRFMCSSGNLDELFNRVVRDSKFEFMGDP